METPTVKTRHSYTEYRVSDLPTATLEQRIRYCRIRAGFSGAEVARLIGVHPDYYHILERKADRIGVGHLQRFCHAVGADLPFILYGSDPPPLHVLTAPTIGARIREFRTSNGMSARQFGYRVLGVKRTTSVNAWESDSAIPELRSLMMIASAFGMSAVSFIPPLSECSMV